MRGRLPDQGGPQHIQLHGWLRYEGEGKVRLGQAIGDQPASRFTLRMAGLLFANRLEVMALGPEGEALREQTAEGWRPARVRGILFSRGPGEEAFLLAVHEGVKVYETEEALAASVALHRAVDELVLDRRRRWGTGVLRLIAERTERVEGVKRACHCVPGSA